jgi:hypothetical protein
MKWLLVVSVAVLLMTGCVSPGPAISKSSMGNLELNIRGMEEAQVGQADIYIDGQYIGNASSLKPVLYLRRGERQVRVQLSGFKTYEGTITILGDPNHQVLNVILERQ